MPLLRISMCLAALVLTGTASAQDATRSIQQLTDDLYRVTSGHYRSMYWLTDEGIVLIDPIDAETAKWLKTELEQRHPVPVRYVIYSHNHFDHIYGGEIFDDPRTIFVSHELAREDIVRTNAHTRIPELTFTDEIAIHLGGETLTLRHHGTNNGLGSVSMHFEDAGVMFVVDWIVLGRMPYRDLPGYDIAGMMRSTREVLDLNGWDTLVGGHAEMGDRADVERYLAYLEALHDTVLEGMLAGKPLEQLQEEIRLDGFDDLTNYEEWLPLNIAGVHRMLADRSYVPRRPENETADEE